jgi:hypothetical protein
LKSCIGKVGILNSYQSSYFLNQGQALTGSKLLIGIPPDFSVLSSMAVARLRWQVRGTPLPSIAIGKVFAGSETNFDIRAILHVTEGYAM